MGGGVTAVNVHVLFHLALPVAWLKLSISYMILIKERTLRSVNGEFGDFQPYLTYHSHFLKKN